MYCLPLSNPSSINVQLSGGKAANLAKLAAAGFNVPPGFVVTTAAYNGYAKHIGLLTHLQQTVNFEDSEDIENASQVILAAFRNGSLLPELVQEITSQLEQLPSQSVAVRSSATAEDGQDSSWAGELESFLGVEPSSVPQAVVECWSSLFTSRAILYQYTMGFDPAHSKVGVVVQSMLQPDVAGVAFTSHPVTNDTEQMVIEAVYGLGEPLVSGIVTPDTYMVNKSDCAVIEQHTVRQEQALCLQQSSTEWKSIPEEQQKVPKLSSEQISTLGSLAKDIELLYGYPCDIEWALADGEFYILQSRPITTIY